MLFFTFAVIAHSAIAVRPENGCYSSSETQLGGLNFSLKVDIKTDTAVMVDIRARKGEATSNYMEFVTYEWNEPYLSFKLGTSSNLFPQREFVMLYETNMLTAELSGPGYDSLAVQLVKTSCSGDHSLQSVVTKTEGSNFPEEGCFASADKRIGDSSFNMFVIIKGNSLVQVHVGIWVPGKAAHVHDEAQYDWSEPYLSFTLTGADVPQQDFYKFIYHYYQLFYEDGSLTTEFTRPGYDPVLIKLVKAPCNNRFNFPQSQTISSTTTKSAVAAMIFAGFMAVL